MNFINKTIKTITALTLLALLFHACGEDEHKTSPPSEPIKVSVATVTIGKEGYANAGSGQIVAVNNATLSTRIMGQVERIPVKVGQKVNKGALLVAINNVDLQAKQAQVKASIIGAKAAYTTAEKDYNRYVNLFNKNSASQKEFDDVTANFEMAKARLQAAEQMENEVRAQFAYANIKAPFSGVVTQTFIDEGDLANPGMPLVAIEAPGAFEVAAKISEELITDIAVGTKALIKVKALDAELQGKITELSSSSKDTGGQYMATILIENPPTDIKSGMYASIAFANVKTNANQTLTINSKALVENGQLKGVYALGQDNRAILRWLRLGESFGDAVEVLSGLSGDETYIVSAEGKLYNGAKITIQ
ncbi:MAG: efflux RND transporter periplasmic adaptor subunit [Croceitalea sp.]|nr:efflux RND transporter periplasmic adaptor subunit [Croceitalea sp.]